MSSSRGDDRRQARVLGATVDPLVRLVLDCVDPWDAYHAALRAYAALTDELEWMPRGGDIYTAWAGLTDLYDTGMTPIEDAHAALRAAAADWLDRTGPASEAFVDGWLERTKGVTRHLFDRDGDFWQSPG